MNITITRKGYRILSSDSDIPAQGSANIPVVLENDDSYSDYVKEMHCGYFVKGVYKKCILLFEENKYLIPGEVFKGDGPMYLAVAMIKNDEIIKTNQLNFKIEPAPSGMVILPSADDWHILVKDYMDALFRNDYGEKFNAIESNLENLKKDTAELQENVKLNSEKFNELLNSVQDKLSNGDFIPDITLGNVSIGVPNVSFRGTGKDVIVDFTMPEFAGIEEYDKTIKEAIEKALHDKYIRETEEYPEVHTALTVGDTAHYTVLESNGRVRQFTPNHGLEMLALESEVPKVAVVTKSFHLTYSEETEGNINMTVECAYPNGFNSENCAVLTISELYMSEGMRKQSSFSSVTLQAKQYFKLNFNTNISGDQDVKVDIVLLRIDTFEQDN